MTNDRPRRGVGSEFSRGLNFATTIPIMIIFGVIVGYYIGRDHGPIWGGIGALIGGILGLAWAAFEAIRWDPAKEKKRKSNDQFLKLL